MVEMLLTMPSLNESEPPKQSSTVKGLSNKCGLFIGLCRGVVSVLGGQPTAMYQMAVDRYVTEWLPIVCNPLLKPEIVVLPPPDVLWAWITHMQHPVRYHEFCMESHGRLPPSLILSLTSSAQFAKAFERGKKLWKKMTTSEYDIPDPYQPHSPIPSHDLGFDLAQAMAGEIVFAYMVGSRPFYTGNSFLDAAVARYNKFLLFQGETGRSIIAECDIDLVWHTHLLFPGDYEEYTKLVVGYHLPHRAYSPTNNRKSSSFHSVSTSHSASSVNSRSILTSTETARMWLKHYGEHYRHAGTSFCSLPTFPRQVPAAFSEWSPVAQTAGMVSEMVEILHETLQRSTTENPVQPPFLRLPAALFTVSALVLIASTSFEVRRLLRTEATSNPLEQRLLVSLECEVQSANGKIALSELEYAPDMDLIPLLGLETVGKGIWVPFLVGAEDVILPSDAETLHISLSTVTLSGNQRLLGSFTSDLKRFQYHHSANRAAAAFARQPEEGDSERGKIDFSLGSQFQFCLHSKHFAGRTKYSAESSSFLSASEAVKYFDSPEHSSQKPIAMAMCDQSVTDPFLLNIGTHLSVESSNAHRNQFMTEKKSILRYLQHGREIQRISITQEISPNSHFVKQIIAEDLELGVKGSLLGASTSRVSSRFFSINQTLRFVLTYAMGRQYTGSTFDIKWDAINEELTMDFMGRDKAACKKAYTAVSGLAGHFGANSNTMARDALEQPWLTVFCTQMPGSCSKRVEMPTLADMQGPLPRQSFCAVLAVGLHSYDCLVTPGTDPVLARIILIGLIALTKYSSESFDGNFMPRAPRL